MLLLSKADLIVNVHFRQVSPFHPASSRPGLTWEAATLFLFLT
jgi:hypothetical protein